MKNKIYPIILNNNYFFKKIICGKINDQKNIKILEL